ncbi:MAG: hypothetical protein ACHP9Z_10225, partial [Streptosporangiales bacterium]
LTAREYRNLLLASGFTTIRITTTHDAGPGLHSAIIQATRPAAPPASWAAHGAPCDQQKLCSWSGLRE